jgi:hypothetical protein
MTDGWMDGWMSGLVDGLWWTWWWSDVFMVGWIVQGPGARFHFRVSSVVFQLQGTKCGGSTCFNQGRKEGEVIKGDWQLDPQMNQTNFATIILFTFMFTMRNLFCDCLLLDVPCVTLFIVAQCLFPFRYFVRLHASS